MAPLDVAKASVRVTLPGDAIAVASARSCIPRFGSLDRRPWNSKFAITLRYRHRCAKVARNNSQYFKTVTLEIISLTSLLQPPCFITNPSPPLGIAITVLLSGNEFQPLPPLRHTSG